MYANLIFLFSELNLRGCRDLESNAFWHLGKLHMMERLILDSTQIELPTLLVSLQSMTSLSQLSLGRFHLFNQCLLILSVTCAQS